MSGSSFEFDTTYYTPAGKFTKQYVDIRKNIKDYHNTYQTLVENQRYEYGDYRDLASVNPGQSTIINNGSGSSIAVGSSSKINFGQPFLINGQISFSPPTLADGIQKDLNDSLIQENNMLIMGTITSAFLIISAIIISSK